MVLGSMEEKNQDEQLDSKPINSTSLTSQSADDAPPAISRPQSFAESIKARRYRSGSITSSHPQIERQLGSYPDHIASYYDPKDGNASSLQRKVTIRETNDSCNAKVADLENGTAAVQVVDKFDPTNYNNRDESKLVCPSFFFFFFFFAVNLISSQVKWDGPDDPENPKNWPSSKKWAATVVVSLFTFISPVSSSMVAPALPNLASDLKITDDFVMQLTLSIFVLAYAVGPLFLGPLSEVYGRVIVLQLANLFFLVFNIGCAVSKTTTQLLVCRFFAGLGGSAPLAVGI